MLAIPKTIDAARKLRDGLASENVRTAMLRGTEAELAIAQAVADALPLFVAFPALGKYESWAQKVLGGVSVSVLDRYKRGGTVANYLLDSGRSFVPGQTHRALAPFYRFVAWKSETTDEERTAGVEALLAAFDTATKKAGNGPVTEKVAETVAGTKKKGTRGSAKGSKKGTRNTPAADAGKGETEESVAIDPVADEQASKVVAAYFKQCERKGSDIAAVRAVMLRTVAMCKEHGADRIALALSSK